ncbi:MAG: hypothetical protein U0869_06000 [Chloroflexota bacterium]
MITTRTAATMAVLPAAIAMLLGASIPVLGADGDTELAFGYEDRGFYERVTGDPSIENVRHVPDNDYLWTGQMGLGQPPDVSYYQIVQGRSFLVFDLPRTPELVTKAVLRIAVRAESYGSTDDSETVVLRDISHDLDDVIAGGDDTPTVRQIWADLANGTVYGSHVATAADDGTTITIPLNATFRALARNGGRIGIGGAISTLSNRDIPIEMVWGGTYNAYQSSLELTIVGAQPDAWIKENETGMWAGDDVFNTTARKQGATGAAKPGKTVTYDIAIENAGRTADRWTVKGPGSTKDFTVRYLAGPKDVTARVVAGTYLSSRLPEAGFEQLQMLVTPRRTAPKGATLTQRITIRSDSVDAWVDVVKATTRRS